MIGLARGITRFEQLQYAPSLQDSGDLEAATKTITATAEATGVGNADYNCSLTLPAPSDARLVVYRVAARLAVTIDSMTAGTLYGRVYVDAQDADHRLLDLSWTTTGAKLAVADTHSGSLATIFALLKDGAAHTFYFFFWVDAGNAVLSLVELWEAVGTSGTSAVRLLALTHTGLCTLTTLQQRVGSGTATGSWGYSSTDFNIGQIQQLSAAGNAHATGVTVMVNSEISYLIYGTVTTDLNYWGQGVVVLRSER